METVLEVSVDISASAMQAGLVSTVKWTKMSVFLTRARMEERAITW